MKIGIPKGLAIYEYPILYEKFFQLLGFEVIYSDDTNKKILDMGTQSAIDEDCLASKIFIGHVANLVYEKDVDYIFIPRLCTFNKNETICVKFYAIYDICKNMFKSQKFLSLNVDYLKKENEFKAFMRLGKKLGIKHSKCLISYIKAKDMQIAYDKKKFKHQCESLNSNRNVLIVAHPYICYDKYIGRPIEKYLKSMNINVVFADINSSNRFKKKLPHSYIDFSDTLYWRMNKYLLNGVSEYIDKIDGIIYLSVFPCGPDSLVNELAIRRINYIPSINIVVDEQEANAGLYTRLESFVDILDQKHLEEENLDGREKIYC